MRTEVQVEVKHERVIKDSKNKSGAVHLTINGTPLCEILPREQFRKHPSGIQTVTHADFDAHPCGGCLKRLDS